MKDPPKHGHPRTLGGPDCDCMRTAEERPKERPEPNSLRISRTTGERRALDRLMRTANARKRNTPET